MHAPITLPHPWFSTGLPSYSRPYSLQLPSFLPIEVRYRDNHCRHEQAGVQPAQAGICIEFSLAVSNISVVRA